MPEILGPPIPARAVLPLVGWMCDSRSELGRGICRRIVMEGPHEQPGEGRYPDRIEYGRCPRYDHHTPCPHYHTVGKGIRVVITEEPA